MIAAAPSGGPRWMLADWLELEALSSKTASTSVHALNADPLIEPDFQDNDIDEDGQRDDDRIARVTTEIEARIAKLRDAYPFRMSTDGNRLELTPQKDGIGASVYLFCLLASHGRANGFLNGSDVIDMTDVPDLLQACATWSAAGYEHGPSYALGLDPASSAFLPKLKVIYDALGEGVPLTAIPPGAPTEVKDDGIDVIAWKARSDARPPASYFLAQVASGQNWKSKSVKAVIDRFHVTWFLPQPACDAKPAIMIPFCIDGGPEDDEDLPQEALRMHWARLIAQYGELFYRYTIPVYAALGLKLHKEEGVHVDMADWTSRLQDFVSGVIAKLQATAT